MPLSEEGKRAAYDNKPLATEGNGAAYHDKASNMGESSWDPPTPTFPPITLPLSNENDGACAMCREGQQQAPC